MIVKEESNGISYKEIPEALLQRKIGSLKAAYIYVKMCMLVGRTYCREAWVTNPINHQREMSIDCLSDLTARLERAGLIRIAKQDVGTQHKANRYEIVPIEGFYKPIYHDFINHTGLSADAKGLAVLMGLLKDIPKSNNAIGNAIGISGKTVKKYIAELIDQDIFNPETRQLNLNCFPYWKFVNEKRIKPWIAGYRSHIRKVEEDKQVTDQINAGKHNIRRSKLARQIEWLEKLNEPEPVKALLFRDIMCGTLGNRTKTQDTLQANEDNIKPITI